MRNDLSACLLAVVVLSGCAGPDPGVAPDVTVFRGARLIGGDGLVIADTGTLVIRDGRIARVGDSADIEIPSGATIHDVPGRTITPGLVNAHGHVADTQGLQSGAEYYTTENLIAQLQTYASYGVTSVVSLGGDQQAGFVLRDDQSKVGLNRARLFVAGPVVTADTPEDARRRVDEVADLRPDVIKIRVDDNLGTSPKMPLEVAQAVIDQAHQRGLRVAAHVFYLDDAKALVRAGVDFIAHSVRDQAVDDELIALLTDRQVCVSPTLTREISTFVYESEPDFFADPFFLDRADPAVIEALRDPARQAGVRASRSAQLYKVALEVATANVKRLSDGGVSLAFGTDTGPPARFQGYFEHLELGLMADAGLTAQQVLAAATGTAARCSGLEDVGDLRAGVWADFIVLTGDPLGDVRQMRTIESVWVAGARVN